MDRYLTPYVKKDLDKKLVLLSGPRQSGKTTLSQSLYSHSVYLNFDRTQDRKVIRDESWSREKDLVIFDELHKMRTWKRWIKGIYDTEKIPPRLLVTGSARLDVYRKGGDSLAGRHFLYRLHPVSIAEAVRAGIGMNSRKAYERLLSVGGFPEPFLEGGKEDAERWRRGHLDRILREDLLDLEKVRDLKSIEILVDLLAERVGSPISYLSLARDLGISPKTVKHWIEILERMYVIFVVPPYSKNIARAILKEPKIFFYDIGRVVDRPGARLENLVAAGLLKRNHFLEDTRGERRALHYIRDQQKREVDFLTLKNGTPEYLLEVKNSKDDLTPALAHFAEKLPGAQVFQLVGDLNRDLQHGKIKVRECSSWLAELEA